MYRYTYVVYILFQYYDKHSEEKLLNFIKDKLILVDLNMFSNFNQKEVINIIRLLN